MSLTTELKNPDSVLSKFMATIINDAAANKLIAMWNEKLASRKLTKVDGVKEPALVGTAFDYGFRWRVMGHGFDVTKTIAYQGAINLTRLDKRPYCDILTMLVELATEKTHLIASVCIILAWFEQYWRDGSIPVPIATAMGEVKIGASLMGQVPTAESHDVGQLMQTIDSVWSTLINNEMSLLLEFEANPILPNAEAVGGADGDWIYSGILYDCKVSWQRKPFLPMHLKQVVGYALLDWDNKLDLRGLGWYFARQRMRIEYPIHKLISDLADKRQMLKQTLQARAKKLQSQKRQKRKKTGFISRMALEAADKHGFSDFDVLDTFDDNLDDMFDNWD